jgi:hypothetical protein
MKVKTIKKKKENKKVIEIHIYVHQSTSQYINPNGTFQPNIPLNTPYIVTCNN